MATTRTVTVPRVGVPIGIRGTDDVRVHPEYQRFFQTLVERVGGASGLTTDQINEDLNERIDSLELQSSIPVGGIHITVNGENPATALGYGTWSAFGEGRVLVGVDPLDPDFDTVLETGGSKTAVVPGGGGNSYWPSGW